MEFYKRLFVKKQTKQTEYYYNCEQITLYNWSKYLETQDLRYFNSDFKEDIQNKDAMYSVFGEYLELTENVKVIRRFVKMTKIMKLQSKYNTVNLLLDALYFFDPKLGIDLFKEILDNLEKWNYKIDVKKDIFKQIEKIKQRIKGLATQINIIEAELQDDDNKEVANIDAEILTVNRVLELNYKIDKKQTTLKEWVELCKQAKKQSK